MKGKAFLVILTMTLILSLIGLSVSCFIPAGEAPTLELEIYDGPEYSESDGMCYYRVEAIAEGIPEPKIIFEDEDNLSPISSDRVKVGVEPGDSYTLTVTACNSAGNTNFSIILKGECEELPSEIELIKEDTSADKEEETDTEEQEETGNEVLESEEESEDVETETIEKESETEEDSETGLGIVEAEVSEEGTDEGELIEKEPEEGGFELLEFVGIETTIPASRDMSGIVIGGSYVRLGSSPILIGDTTVGTMIKGFLSFDIRALHGTTVTFAELNFLNFEHSNHPESIASSFTIRVFDYGNSLDVSDFAVGGHSATLVSIPTLATSYKISGTSFGGNILKNELQDVLDDRSRDYFQLRISMDGTTNHDDLIDSVDITDCGSQVELYIIYME